MLRVDEAGKVCLGKPKSSAGTHHEVRGRGCISAGVNLQERVLGHKKQGLKLLVLVGHGEARLKRKVLFRLVHLK